MQAVAGKLVASLLESGASVSAGVRRVLVSRVCVFTERKPDIPDLRRFTNCHVAYS